MTAKTPFPQVGGEHTPEAKELLDALTKSAAMLGAVYQWLDKVQAAGGATSISGIASCNAMLKSLEANRERAERLVMEPARAAIKKATQP